MVWLFVIRFQRWYIKSTIYENNYFASRDRKLCLFQIRLNMRSIVTNIQICGFEIKLCVEDKVQRKTLKSQFSYR